MADEPEDREVYLSFSTRLAMETNAAYQAALERNRAAARREDAAPAPEPPAAGASARGPRPMTTPEEIVQAKRRLEAAEKPSGERPIAKELGVSRDAVRYALGKDRRHR